MKKLVNTIQNYAWGSHHAIPELLKKAPNGSPQAELWIGAHHLAPSIIEESKEPLDACIKRDSLSALGSHSMARFGTQLPYLLKVLAAKEPLSLQAHPSLTQAKQGFVDENSRHIPLGDSTRNFKDDNHKPELIVAHSPFVALCGFRPIESTVLLMESIAPKLAFQIKELGLKTFVSKVLGTENDLLVSELTTGLTRNIPGFERDIHWGNVISKKYPNDIGLVVAMLLNCIELEPHEGLFLGAGNLHAYLEGTGIELMANSDNVLRGGLTSKHIDVKMLLSVLQCNDNRPIILNPQPNGIYDTPVDDFRLSLIHLSGTKTMKCRGPEILLVTNGTIKTPMSIDAGESVFVPFSDGDYELSGDATLYRAEIGSLQ